MRGFILILVGVLVPAVAAAQQYQPWQDPGARNATAGGDQRLQDFVDRLNGLVDKAEKSRAADSRFLRDLRDLARGFDRPWRTQVLADDFRDGDFTKDPAWTVTAGRYLVQRDWGLRSIVEAGAAEAAPDRKRLTGKDAAVAIFGQILGQAIGQRQGGGGGDSRAAGTGTGAAAIETALSLTNAFAIEMDLSSWKAQGRLEFGPTHGAAKGAGRAPGYLLVYTSGGALELLRVSARGSSVIDSRPGPLSLEDKKTHRIEWTRRADGEMTVSIDGQEMLKTTDRGFGGPFDGFRMVNRGGDYILGRIAVWGTEKG